MMYGYGNRPDIPLEPGSIDFQAPNPNFGYAPPRAQEMYHPNYQAYPIAVIPQEPTFPYPPLRNDAEIAQIENVAIPFRAPAPPKLNGMELMRIHGIRRVKLSIGAPPPQFIFEEPEPMTPKLRAKKIFPASKYQSSNTNDPDEDYSDPDYFSSNSRRTFKERYKPGFSTSPQLEPKRANLPSNVYTTLAYSAWPTPAAMRDPVEVSDAIDIYLKSDFEQESNGSDADSQSNSISASNLNLPTSIIPRNVESQTYMNHPAIQFSHQQPQANHQAILENQNEISSFSLAGTISNGEQKSSLQMDQQLNQTGNIAVNHNNTTNNSNFYSSHPTTNQPSTSSSLASSSSLTTDQGISATLASTTAKMEPDSGTPSLKPYHSNTSENQPNNSSNSNPSNSNVVLSVPEYEKYLETCDDEMMLAELNYPSSIQLAGLADWSSPLEKKMIKQGYVPPQIITHDSNVNVDLKQQPSDSSDPQQTNQNQNSSDPTQADFVTPSSSTTATAGNLEVISSSSHGKDSNTASTGVIASWDEAKWNQGTYINCDLRYYDLGSLGKFDVVLIDPPWRLRGGQTISDERTMFTNNKFSLQYNTMSNEEIMDLEVGRLSVRGFCFLWTINSQLQAAFECLNRWGYSFVDRITWIKKTNKDSIFIGQGYYLLHSSEICLIGAKKDIEGNYLEVVHKVSNDLIFAPIQKKSQKPEQMYHIIEKMFPGARKVELFARNHNIRPGWLSLGNQLGKHFNWSHDNIDCDHCQKTIQVGTVRFKHRKFADRDLCSACILELKEDPSQYFELHNQFDDMSFHEYFECNGCQTHPLWGIRFRCDQCPDFDLCEQCHDSKNIPPELQSVHTEDHSFTAIETPQLAGGLPVHRHRCMACNTYPIIGYRFKCVVCTGTTTSLCQKCFFAQKEPKSHLRTHETQLIIEPLLVHSQIRCDICKRKPIIGNRYKCDQCYNFDICKECFQAERPPPTNYASHKPSHTFSILTGDADYTPTSATASSDQQDGDEEWCM